MKAINKLAQILTLLFSVTALVLFFTDFATIVTGSGSVTLVGAQLAFGSKVDLAGTTYDMARSAKLLFCMLLTLFALVCAIVNFFAKGFASRYASPAFALVGGIFMLVVALRQPAFFVDTRPLPAVDFSALSYSFTVLLTSVALLLAAAAGIAHLLLADAIAVQASKGTKYTIPQRVVRFFRDYKSETKKIVWPSLRSVLKNTGIVLLMCVLIGAVIWLLDFGLGQLLDLLIPKAS